MMIPLLSCEEDQGKMKHSTCFFFVGLILYWLIFHGVVQFGTDYIPHPELQEQVLNTEEEEEDKE